MATLRYLTDASFLLPYQRLSKFPYKHIASILERLVPLNMYQQSVTFRAVHSGCTVSRGLGQRTPLDELPWASTAKFLNENYVLVQPEDRFALPLHIRTLLAYLFSTEIIPPSRIMPPRRNTRDSPSRKGSSPPVEVNFYQESGVHYRPFTDPKRIESNDARRAAACDARARTKGVPDSFLGVLSPEPYPSNHGTHMNSPSTSTSGPQEHVLGSGVWLTHTNADYLGSSFGQYPVPSSSAYTTKSTVDDPYNNSSPLYDFSQHCYAAPQYPLPQNQPGFIPPIPAVYGDADSLDLDDPAVLAHALEVAQNMRLEDMDLDLLRQAIDYNTLMHDRDGYTTSHSDPDVFSNHGY